MQPNARAQQSPGNEFPHTGAAQAPRLARRYMPWADALWPTLALVAVVTAARLAYLAWFSPFTLAEDEAHYWEWARRLDWSYYSKGPGVAWTIALSTWLLGETELGVRTMAPLFGAVLALACAAMANLVWRDRRAGMLAASVVLLTPVYQGAALLMTIDGPFLAMWATAGVCAVLALRRGSRWALLGLGAAVAVGFLYKYTILLIVPGILIYALVDRSRLRVAPRAWGWALGGVGIALAGLLPVAIWNAQHDWATVRHLLGHLGVAGGDLPTGSERGGSESGERGGYSPLWTLEFFGLQLAMAGPGALLGLATAWTGWRAHRRSPSDATSGMLLLGLMAIPVLGFYLAVTGFTRIEGNWPIAAYTSLASLAGIGFVAGLETHRRRRDAWLAHPKPRPRTWGIRPAPESPAQILWHWTLGYGLIAGVLLPRMDLLAKIPMLEGTMPIKRLTRAEPAATLVESAIAEISDTAGEDANDPNGVFVAAGHYGMASLMAFYLPGKPVVYCSQGAAPSIPEQGIQRGRQTQYDHWAETDLRDPDTIARLRGRDAVLVGGWIEQWALGFESVHVWQPSVRGSEHAHPEVRRRDDLPIVMIGRGFKGFAPRPRDAEAQGSENRPLVDDEKRHPNPSRGGGG